MLTYLFLLLSALAKYQPATIEPPFSPAPLLGEPDRPRMLKPAPALARVCRDPGSVCVFAGGADTYGDAEDISPRVLLPVLRRSFHLASMAAEAPPADRPWQVEIVARFKKPSAEAAINVVVLDKDDPEAIANKEAVMILDVYTQPTKLLAMRFDLRPEDGFVAGHSYLLRLVQTEDGHETVLAEGSVNLD